MDAVGLTILLKEIEADCMVIQDAARKARLRLGEETDGRLEACAYELTRLYNVFERILERIWGFGTSCATPTISSSAKIG